jgi:hypothetical protein
VPCCCSVISTTHSPLSSASAGCFVDVGVPVDISSVLWIIICGIGIKLIVGLFN